MTWIVRSSLEEDRAAILEVVRDAFSGDDRDGQEEVDIVADTWSLDAAPHGLDLVAVEGAAVLGHVLGARGRLGGREAIGVAPLAVTPSRQHEGIGSALMTELLRRAEDLGWPLVVLLGSPMYYERLGFEPARPLGIVYVPVGAGNPHFQVHKLTRYDDSHRGEFNYCWEMPS